MGDQEGRLVYDGEEAGEDPLITAQYSATCLPWLLAVGEILLQEQLWAPDTDWDEIEPQLHDLINRLMGVTIMAGVYHGGYPLVVPAAAMAWNPSVGPTFYYDQSSYFTNSCVVTNGTNEAIGMFWLNVALPVGDFILEFWYSKGPNMGKIDVGCTVDPDLVDLLDCYAATPSHNHRHTAEFENDEPRIVTIGFNKQVKNPSSSSCQLLISCVSVREKTQYD